MGMALKIRTILLERNMSVKELSDKLGCKGTNESGFFNALILYGFF